MNLVTVTTDTATICIFDPEAMRHRKDDVGDWWSLPQNELEEIRLRNAIFLKVGSDGTYSVSVGTGSYEDSLQLSLKVPSGMLFVEPGEEMTGGGFEPTGEWGGEFIAKKSGDYRVSISRDGNAFDIRLLAHAPFDNKVSELVRL